MTEEKDLEQVPDTSGIDVVEGERLQESSVEETAVLEPVTSDEEAAEVAGEEEPEKKRGRVLPFLLSHKVAAGGIAAALVVGAIGIGVASLQAADAGAGGVAAEQKADASAKTPAAKTGANPGTTAAGAEKPADTATAPDAGAAGAEQAEAAAGGTAATDPAATAAEGDSQTSANGGEQANPSSGTASDAKQSSSGSGSSAGSSSGSSASSGGSSSGGSSSSSGSSSKPASKPAHEHDWQPVTDKQWVPNIVTVQAAYDEPIYEYVTVCNCGAVFESANDWADHNEEYAIQGIGGHNSHGEKRQTGTKHHDAVTEDQGHYETITTGYKCSCGATK